MPPKPRTRRTLGSTPQQSTLSFNNKATKVTKSAAAPTPSDQKATSKLNELARDEIIDQISEPEPESETIVKKAEAEKNGRPTDTARDDVRDDVKDAAKEEEEEVAFRPKSKSNKTRISSGSTASTKAEQESLETAIANATKITDAQIKKYWKAEEDARIAPRVHQEGLPVHEKILRHFDLSSQYGPCIGIPRLDRWKRAFTLSMDPPPVVLAVLLKEEDKGAERGDRKKGGETRQCGRLAYVDELAGGKVVLVE